MTERPRRKVGQQINLLRVVCRQCGSTPWEGDNPRDNPRQLLADFADTQCPIGGTANGCPSTTEAQTAEREVLPLTRIARLVERLDRLAARVTALEQTAPRP